MKHFNLDVREMQPLFLFDKRKNVFMLSAKKPLAIFALSKKCGRISKISQQINEILQINDMAQGI